MPDLSVLPVAKKLNIPPGGWPSHRSEFVVEGEANRFRYVTEDGYKLADGPGSGPSGERRIFCRLPGRRGTGFGLFEEMLSWGRPGHRRGHKP